MNNLNSVLIEGELADNPVPSRGPEDMAITKFLVRSKRSTKNRDGKMITRTIGVPCTTLGRLAEVCGEYLKKGRGVRVVGRIDSDGGPADAPLLYLVAEHVEFKPQLKAASQ